MCTYAAVVRRAAGAILLVMFSVSMAAEERTIEFNIPPQTLSSAIRGLSEQANIQALYAEETVAGIRSGGLRGAYTVREAMEKLLEGSNLSFDFTSPAVVVVRRNGNAGGGASIAGDDRVQFADIVVRDTVLDESFTSRSTEEAREALGRIPGGATLIGDQTMRAGAVSSAQDALSFAPGVIVRTNQGGQDQSSIRGSGLLNPDATYGVRFLRDGLSLTRASGSGELQDFDFFNARYVEVYRGGSGLAYGAPTLGGAINIVTYTGYDADLLRARVEAGSFSYLRTQLSSGQVLGGGWDYYASLSTTNTDGFRDHTKEETWRGYGNLGYRWNDRHETRLYLTVMDSNQQDAGELTLAQIDDDPSQAQLAGFGFYNYPEFNSGLNYPLTRIDLKHSIRLGQNDRVDFGVYYNAVDFDAVFPFGYFDSDHEDLGFSARGEHHGSLAERENRLIWGINIAKDDIYYAMSEALPGGHKGDLFYTEDDEARNAEVYIQDQWSINSTLSLVVGAQANYAYRKLLGLDADGATVLYDPEETYRGYSAVAGLVWQGNSSTQWFGNVSRGYEPPTWAKFYNFDTESAVDAQKATTLELGTRGRSEGIAWELVFYHSRIKDEILAIETPPGSGRFSTSNAGGDTLKSGVELGLEVLRSLGVFTSSDQMRFRLNHIYNHFRFEDDPSFGANRIAAVPEHIGKAELFYLHPFGFYLGPTLEHTSNAYADFANTLKVDSYTLVGFKAGYDVGNGLSLFLEGRNLTDEHYVSSIFIVADAEGIDQELFRPGQTRSVFAGLEYLF